MDDQLVQHAVQGKVRALERLLLDAYPRLVSRIGERLPESLRSLIAPDDIIQEAYASAFRRIESFRPEGEGAFFRWLCTIADNALTDAIRAQQAAKRGGGRVAVGGLAHSSIAALVEIAAAESRTPSRSAGGHEAAAAIQIALAGLKDEYREALRLRYLEALPISEVAARLGKSEPSVHKLCSRGLQSLREALGDPGRFESRS